MFICGFFICSFKPLYFEVIYYVALDNILQLLDCYCYNTSFFLFAQEYKKIYTIKSDFQHYNSGKFSYKLELCAVLMNPEILFFILKQEGYSAIYNSFIYCERALFPCASSALVLRHFKMCPLQNVLLC